jgi:hypothetical protein
VRHGIAASRYREQAPWHLGIKTKPRLVDVPPVSKELKKRWSYFIRKVYETDPPPILDSQFWIFDYRSMRNQTEFDVSGAFVFSVIENRQSKIQNHLNTLVYGKSPTLVLKETLR